MKSKIFSKRYQKLMRSFEVGEPTVSYGRLEISEKLMQCIWYEQWFQRGRFITLDRREIEIISPGWWNYEAGPDFKNAEIRFIPGETVCGDIELHLYSSDWFRHNHHKDPRYRRVILHGIMKNDLDEKLVSAVDGKKIPQLILYGHLAKDLNLLKQAVDLGIYPKVSRQDLGKCYEKIRAVSPSELGQLFDLAGDQRILNKSNRFLKEMETRPAEEVLYGAIAQALGYKDKKVEFRELSLRLPMKFLKKVLRKLESFEEKLITLQALFFGVSRLLPEENLQFLEPENLSYVKKLSQKWKSLSSQFVFERMHSQQWKTVSTRPANFPARRMAALSWIIINCSKEGIFSVFRKIFEGELSPDEMFKLLSQIFSARDKADFWRWHYNFDSKKLSKPVRLSGKDRISVILINAVIPALLAFARKRKDSRLKKNLYGFYISYPPLAGESVVKFVSRRMFGEEKPRLVNSARRQQGLHQIFNDCCLQRIGCKDCPFLRLLEK